MERFIGQPNVESTHRAIEATVSVELSRNGLIPVASVETLPTDEHTVLIVVEFNSVEEDDRVVVLVAGLDLRKGLVFARTDYRES